MEDIQITNEERIKRAFEEGYHLEISGMEEELQEYCRQKLGMCYEEIIKLIDYYMDMPLNSQKIIALWIIGTYFHSFYNTYPFLFINAIRGGGKTRLLKIISHLAKLGFGQVQTGITEAVLFRMPKGQTLCLDEAENMSSKEKSFLREYLNACYKKGGVVKRTKKIKTGGEETFALETFEPYKPIAMANIWGMEEVLGDRCISILLEKSDNSVKTKKQEDFEDNPFFNDIKRTLQKVSVVMQCSYAKNNIKTLWNQYIQMLYSSHTYTHIYTHTLYTLNNITTEDEKRKEIEVKLKENELDEFFQKIDKTNINGRNLELFFPLLQMIRSFSETTFEEILEISKTIVNLKKEDEFIDSKDVSVYDFVASYKENEEYISMKELSFHFRLFTGEEDIWINEKWLGRALKRLNLIRNKKRFASGIYVLLNIPKAKEKLKIFKKSEEIVK